jgi:hypothetical protein
MITCYICGVLDKCKICKECGEWVCEEHLNGENKCDRCSGIIEEILPWNR